MPTIAYVHRRDAPAETAAVYEEIMRTYGLDEPRGIYLLMGHTPAHLAASWQRSRYCYGRKSGLTLKEKHLLTLAISAANNCEYCVRSHTVRLRQLKTTEEELVELLAVEHAASGWSVLAHGMRLGDDPTIFPAAPAESEFRSPLIAAVGESAASELLAVLQHDPLLAEPLLRSLLGCFAQERHLDLAFKHKVGLCVAAAAGSDYWVAIHTGWLKEHGVPDRDLAELVFVVDVVCGYNRYVHGLQVDPREGLKPWGSHAEANNAES